MAVYIPTEFPKREDYTSDEAYQTAVEDYYYKYKSDDDVPAAVDISKLEYKEQRNETAAYFFNSPAGFAVIAGIVIILVTLILLFTGVFAKKK